MTSDLFLILGGLACLALGGEALVRGAVGLALRLKVTPAVIGLTVVAAGTSMPELVVSVLAALRGSADIAVANVVGSNIFNIGFVLGCTAIVLALPVESATLRLEWPFLMAVSVLTALCMIDSRIDPLEGGGFLLFLAVFIVYAVRLARRAERERRDNAVPSDVAGIGRGGILGGTLAQTVLLAVGIGILIVGGKLVVDGAQSIALRLGMSERIVGLTVVAMGTSLPELASSLVAAIRGRADVAVGNVIGSCIFNLLGILGVGSLLRPLAVNPRLSGDVLWMLAFTLVLAPMIYFGKRRVSRMDGFVLLVLFTAYMTLLVRGA